MNGSFDAIPISEHIYWVGAIDWNVRDFHGYSTRRGSTYNAYLVLGEKIALVVKYVPEETALAKGVEFGKQIAAAVRGRKVG